MTRMLALAAGLAAAMLGGCWPTVTAPIGADVSAPKALYGTWIGRAGDPDVAPAYLHILAGEDGTLDLFLIRTDGDSGVGWSQFRATYGEVAGTSYLTGQGLEAVDSKDVIPAKDRYTLTRIVLTADTLDIFFGAPEGFNAAVKAGRLAGEIMGDYSGPDLSGTPSEIAAFLEGEDPQTLFPEHFASLRRAPALTAHP